MNARKQRFKMGSKKPVHNKGKNIPIKWPWVTMGIGETFETPYIFSGFVHYAMRQYKPLKFKAYQRKCVCYVERIA